MGNLEGSGIEREALWRYIDEQIYSLPGTTAHRDAFTILLTGSRAIGVHTPESDVDIDVLCPLSVYDSVHHASLEAGIIKADLSFFCVLGDDDWRRYFGRQPGRPHFALAPLEEVERQFREYDDVWLWIWTNTKVIADPGSQFQRVVDGFEGYPKDVLVRKIKYRWLLAAYWAVEVYPQHPTGPHDIPAAATAILNSVNDLLRLFFLVEGKPFPYPEKLMPFAADTRLGRDFCPMLQHVVDLVVGRADAKLDAWSRLERAGQLLVCSDLSADCRRLEEACARGAIAAGVPERWVEADFANIDELLLGRLGPVP
jgi:hypothetical protein